MPKCNVIAVTNQKGGVGKITTKENVMIGLARSGFHVLIVDFDSQGNLTTNLGWRDNVSMEHTVSSMLDDYINDRNIDSQNVVIYGHSSKWSNIIFTPLMSYIDENYYLKHPTFEFITESGTRTYKIFDVMNIDLNNLNDSLEFTKTSWDAANEFNIFISDSINHGLYKTRETATPNDKLITLVTCDTRDNNKRIVILAKMISNE